MTTKAEEFAQILAGGIKRDNGHIDALWYEEVLKQYGRLVQEAAAQLCVKQRDEFLSPEYAVGQPISSFSERFACSELERKILEMPLP